MILALMLVVAQAAAPAPVPPTVQPVDQSPATAATMAEGPASAEAYFAFLEARRLEESGEADAAVRALQRAAKADPASAEIPAELAALHARQNDPDNAGRAARAALALDPENAEANFVLGTVLASSLPETGADPAARAEAMVHLDKARLARPFDQGLALLLARLRLSAGETTEAIELLQPLASAGTSVEAGFLLAQSFERAGQLARATEVLRETLDAEPRFFRGWTLLGELAERQRDYAAAAVAYGRAVALNPRGVEMQLRQGQALLNADQPAAARQVLRDAVAATPTEGMGLYLLSDAERRVGDLDAAESTARRLLALEPSGLRGAYALAQVFEDRHDYAQVVATLEPVVTQANEARKTQPRQVVSLLITLGLAHQELGAPDRAIAVFERARQLVPSDPGIGVYLAQAQLAAGEDQQALATIEAGRKAVPESTSYVRLEAAALAKLGRHEEAVATLTPLATAPDAPPELVVALATAQSDAGRLDEALATLTAAERRLATTPALAFQRGALLERAGRDTEAESAFKDALRRDPLHAPTLNYFGYMLADRNQRLEEAVSMIRRALEVEPHNPSYIDSLGWALFKMGRYEEARTELARAAERLPRNSVVQDHYGDALARLGDTQAALTAWRAALAGDGDEIDRAAIERKIAEATR